MTVRVLLNGEPMPADWKVARYWGETVTIKAGDVLVVTADRVLTEAEAPEYLNLLCTRSRQGARP